MHQEPLPSVEQQTPGLAVATTQRGPVYHVISHTHWDREWYFPFEQMRLKLVEMMDRLLEILREDPQFIFHLDAQTVVLEDYLQIRPARRAELARYIAARRLLVGPWYVQNDFFLTSGEATIRNLLIGTRQATAYGHCEKVGYAPDQFGLIGQLPQLLNGFGIDTCIFGRGYLSTPLTRAGRRLREDELHPIEFLWRAGGEAGVYTIHMPCWYNNAQRFSTDIARARAYLDLIERRLSEFCQTPFRLLMNGVDHLEAQENLRPILSAINEQLDVGRIEQTTLAQHLACVRRALPAERWSQHHGELREGADDSILQNTLSSRVYLKQSNVRAQDLLERRLEPLYALLGLHELRQWPADEFDYLWRELLKQHAHDNICGCSCDAVHRDMETRFEHIMQLGEALQQRGLKLLADHLDRSAMEPGDLLLLLVNPLTAPRTGTFEAQLDLPDEGDWEQFEVLDPAGRPVACEILEVTRRRRGTFSPINLPGQLTVRSVRLLLNLNELPALGWSTLRIRRTAAGVGLSAAAPCRPPVATTPAPQAIENEHLRVQVEADGTLRLEDRRSGLVYEDLLSFIDEADTGHSYNFRPEPTPGPRRLRQVPTGIRVTKGPLRQSLELDFAFDLPVGYDRTGETRTRETVVNPLTLRLVLDAGSPRLNVQVALENRSRDHRLRLCVRSGVAGDVTASLAPFEVVERNRAALWSSVRTEYSQPTSGAVAIAHAGRALTLLTEGLAEYEHRPGDAGELELTLVRATGAIFNDAFVSHEAAEALPPSPEWIVPENQCLRALELRLALQPGTERPAALETVWQDFITPPLALFDAANERLFIGGRPCVQDSEVSEIFYRDIPAELRTLPLAAGLLSLASPAAVLTAIKRAETDDQWVVRLYNPTPQPCAATLHFRQVPVSPCRLRLDETLLEPLASDGRDLPLSLKAGEIVTIGFELPTRP